MSEVPGRLLVVGATSGIGRAVARSATERGARVAAVADVSDADACRAAVDDAVATLGGLDALAYCAGVAPLGPLEETTADEWDAVLATNITGAAYVTAAALPHLAAAGGAAAYLSSLTSSQPWPWLGAYSAAKAGLDGLVAAWRTEHPEVRFVRVVVSPTMTGLADDWPADRLDHALRRWSDEGYAADGIQSPDGVATAVLRALDPTQTVTDITVSP